MTLTVWVLGGGCYSARVLDDEGNLQAAFTGPAGWVLEHLPQALGEPAPRREPVPPGAATTAPVFACVALRLRSG